MNLKNASILIIDDDPDVLTAVRLLLKTEVKMVVTEKSPERLRDHLAKNNFDLILLDMNFNSSVNTGNEGIFWLKEVRKMKPDISVIMITAYGDIDLAVRSLKEGASDFVVKPWHNEKLIETIKSILKNKDKGAGALGKLPSNIDIIGCSAPMQDIFQKIEKIAPTDANILILGENGTGKDLVAKVLHEQSLRAQNPFIKVDVGALTDTLFESELFGHKKGSFTGANEDRLGRFEAANGGTLFLDEIGNISLIQQAKLLSILQSRQVIRIGTNVAIPVDIRLVCATNLQMKELANENRFRKDLMYRINTVEIVIPPLRERKDDIILLAKHFCEVYTNKYMKPLMAVNASAQRKLLDYHFPGNVRELQYLVERAVIMAEHEELYADDIVFSPLESATSPVSEHKVTNLNALEKTAILNVIQKYNGNITKAAQELGLTRTALYRRINKYDI